MKFGCGPGPQLFAHSPIIAVTGQVAAVALPLPVSSTAGSSFTCERRREVDEPGGTDGNFTDAKQNNISTSDATNETYRLSPRFRPRDSPEIPRDSKREEFLQPYHKRSNVESTFSMMKRKFRDGLRSKTDVAMVHEVLCKVLCHNLVVLIHETHELGIDPVFWSKAA